MNFMNANHMLTPALFLLIAFAWSVASPADCRAALAARAVTVKETQRGRVVSADAHAEPFDNLLRDLGSQCDIRITCRGGCRLSQPVKIHFHNLPLEQAIKKLIRAAGINNYLIRFRDEDSGQPAITEIVVFGNRTTATATLNRAGTGADQKRREPDVAGMPPAASPDAYAKKIASIQERYPWDDEETRAWAVHLLEAMPDEVKDFGLDHLMHELDKAIESEGTASVNNELLYRAIEAAAPPGVAPAMMRQVRKLSARYRDRAIDGKPDPSREGLRQTGLSEGRQ